ncbi:flagellar hook-length control protein FliK [Bartonella schoenbuchensis]|uniref:Hook-length control protein FliK n=1 Tax=Bartonella schoenbuchensis (strain DSM 13525 / NCTC 13165 / R1) TaxID=687861 RepID=E6Z128_BARSR|nr:flagellar hook-length control protein FliK [Bartonella schoenbuchensis]AQX31218.1 hook-length control protein FliK [Bartonella schoenbuchensis R1]CBI82816.1 putative flagellar motor protein [Bartonella schoenbuchensis R1]
MMINTDELCDILSTSVSKVNKTLVQPKEGGDNQLREAFKALVSQGMKLSDEKILEEDFSQAVEEEALKEDLEQDDAETVKAKDKHLKDKKRASLQDVSYPLCLVQQFMKQEKIAQESDRFEKNENVPSSMKSNVQDQKIADIQRTDVVKDEVQGENQVKTVEKNPLAQKFVPNFTHSVTQNSEPLMARLEMGVEKSQLLEDLEIGDKLTLEKENSNLINKLSDVDITLNKKVGHVQLLRLKLTPAELGTIDAKLRMSAQGLHVELHIQRQETARLLADNQQMLVRILEKVPVNDDSRVLVSIIDKNAQTIQHGQSSQMDQGAGQNDSGQNFNGQRQAFGHKGQNEQNESKQFFKQFLLVDSSLLDISVDNVHPHDPYRLVV